MASIRGLRKSALSITANYSWGEKAQWNAKKVNHLLLYAYLMYLFKKKHTFFWLMQQTRNVLSLVFSCCTTTCTIGEN